MAAFYFVFYIAATIFTILFTLPTHTLTIKNNNYPFYVVYELAVLDICLNDTFLLLSSVPGFWSKKKCWVFLHQITYQDDLWCNSG